MLSLEWPVTGPLLLDLEREIFLPRAEFLEGLRRIREEAGYDGELHAVRISGGQWGRREACAAGVLALASDFLRHKGPNGERLAPFFRFGALFFPPRTPDYYDGHDAERALRYLETLLRMAIKGVLHYGFTGLDHVFSGVEVEVLGLVLDGDEHLPRSIDSKRVVERLRWELRPGLTLAPEFEIRAVDSNPARHVWETRDFEDSELVQVTDLLLGAVRFIAEGSYKGQCPPEGPPPALHQKLGGSGQKRAWVYRPLCELLKKNAERWKKNAKAWANSGHYRSLSLSRAELVKGQWQFHNVEWAVDEEKRLRVPLFPEE